MATRLTWGLGAVLVAAAVMSCSGGDAELVDGTFTPEEWATIKTLSPLPEKPPPDTTNKYADDPKAAVLGQQFFFDKGFSGPLLVGDDGTNGGFGAVGEEGKIACVSCHEGEWMIDLHSKPNNATLGADWLPRNSNTVVNVAFYGPWFENDGVSDSMWSDALIDPDELSIAMNGSRLRVVHVIYDKYKAEYDAVFDPDLDASIADLPANGKPGMTEWETLAPEKQKMVNTVFANFGKALEAYMRLLVSGNAAFDKYVAGDTSALSPSAKNGLKLFVGKANCVECHKTSHFSDDKFHVIGMVAEGPHIVPDEIGRANVLDRMKKNPFNSNGEFSDDRNTGRLDDLPASDAEVGKWRTKGLRNVAKTGPYMHTGQFDDLTDIVKFYNDGGDEAGFVGTKDKAIKELNLTDSEIADIVAFLESLTGDPVPVELRTDTSKK
jgi:cytochrome c peroxidase